MFQRDGRIQNVSAPLYPYIYFSLTRGTFFCLSYKIVGRDERAVLTFSGPLSVSGKTSGNSSAKDIEMEWRNSKECKVRRVAERNMVCTRSFLYSINAKKLRLPSRMCAASESFLNTIFAPPLELSAKLSVIWRNSHAYLNLLNNICSVTSFIHIVWGRPVWKLHNIFTQERVTIIRSKKFQHPSYSFSFTYVLTLISISYVFHIPVTIL